MNAKVLAAIVGYLVIGCTVTVWAHNNGDYFEDDIAAILIPCWPLLIGIYLIVKFTRKP